MFPVNVSANQCTLTFEAFALYWHFCRTCHNTFTLHIDLTGISWGGGDGGEVASEKAGKPVTAGHSSVSTTTTIFKEPLEQFPIVFMAAVTLSFPNPNQIVLCLTLTIISTALKFELFIFCFTKSCNISVATFIPRFVCFCVSWVSSQGAVVFVSGCLMINSECGSWMRADYINPEEEGELHALSEFPRSTLLAHEHPLATDGHPNPYHSHVCAFLCFCFLFFSRTFITKKDRVILLE